MRGLDRGERKSGRELDEVVISMVDSPDVETLQGLDAIFFPQPVGNNLPRAAVLCFCPRRLSVGKRTSGFHNNSLISLCKLRRVAKGRKGWREEIYHEEIQ